MFALLRALRRCWLRAICLGLMLAAAAGAATWFWLPPAKLTARTMLRLDPNSKFIFPVAQANNPFEYQRTQIGLLKSRPVLSGALQEVSQLETVKAHPDPLAWLEKEVSADFQVAQNLMRIQMSGHDREDLKKLVSAVRDSYTKNILDKERDSRNEYLARLTKLREEQQEKLKAKKNALGPLAVQAGGIDPAVRSIRQMFMQQYLSSVERDLIRTRSDLTHCKTELALRDAEAKALADAKVPQELVDEMLRNEPTVQKLQQDVAELNSTIEKHKARSLIAPEKDTALLGYQSKLKRDQKALDDERHRLRPQVTEKARIARSAELTKDIGQLKSQLAIHEANEKELSDQVDRLTNSVQQLAKDGLRLDVNQDELTVLEGLTKFITDQEAQLRIEINEAPKESADVIEDTLILRANEETRLILMTIAASVGTLALVVLAFAFWEFRARRVGAADDVSHGLGMNLMGTLPDARARSYGATSHGDAGHSLLAEAVDATRTILLRAARTDGLRVVMVTSAHSGEGKTSLSTHLAASLAGVGYRTLFIDGDLRNPIAHRVFELDSEPGFCELLRGEAPANDLIRQTAIDQLCMLPAGRWDGDASRALGREGFLTELLQPLRADFDFVIIDSSPVLPVVDPLLIGQQADGTILSVLRDVSRMPSVYAAHQRLLAGGVKVLGAVVNGVRGEAYGATYYYRQGAGA
jgi:capsular exopolysaccharide synthesis family protein